MAEIIVPIIAALITLAGTITTVVMGNRSTLAALDKKSEISDEKIHGEIAVIKTEIKTLSDRVSVHNNLIDRMYKAETDIKLLQQEMEDKK